MAVADDQGVGAQLQELMTETGTSAMWFGAEEETGAAPAWKWVSQCADCAKGPAGCGLGLSKWLKRAWHSSGWKRQEAPLLREEDVLVCP